MVQKKGDNVVKDEVILELETDKVSQEIYALENGSLIEIFFQEGEDVKIGDTLASIETSNKPELKNEEKKPNKVQEKSLLKNESFEIIIPSLGESITEATIGKWIKMKVKKFQKASL